MPVDTPHPAYSEAALFWKQCRDCVEGSAAVKGARERYLPRLSGMGRFDEYEAYVARTMYYNAPGRTVDALAGLISQKEPTVEAPKGSEPFLDDVDLAGTSLETFAHHAAREVLVTGRFGVLADVATGGERRPYLSGYRAEDIVSWKTVNQGGDELVVRVVFHESVEATDVDDPYKVAVSERYRECILDADRVYRVRVWRKSDPALVVDTTRTPWTAGDWITPTRRGVPLNFIPFVFLNATHLTSAVDAPPILALTDLTLSHYRSSADLEHLLHFVACPTPWVAGAADAPLTIGSSVAWSLPEHGKAGMLEMSGQGATALREHLQHKERLMATLGARLLEQQPKGAETATAVNMRHSAEHATLRGIAQVLERGLSMALRIVLWWAGIEETIADVPARVELNKDFFAQPMTPDELRAALQAYQEGAIAFETLYANLVRGELARPGVGPEDERRAIDAAATSTNTGG